MKQIFILSKKDLGLSKDEVLRIYNVRKYELVDNLLILKSKKDFSSRLAYTKEAYDLLFECEEKDVEDVMKKFDWNKIYKESFSLKIINKKNLNEKKLAGIIWNKLKNPKVDLKSAKTKIVLFLIKERVIAGTLKSVTDKSFLKRKAHLRPELHPTSLHPQLARACINLTGKTKGRLLDPFCGSGGILIEAGILGFDITGYDIDKIMINRSRINLEHYGIKSFNLELTNAVYIKGRFDCIVTDLPYGRASKVTDELISLYKNFLKSAYKATKTAVVLFPDFVDYRKVIGKWKAEKEFGYYLHKSLSKKIVILTHP